jgi:D-glycero-D-manno-heptose 1,7-bisphosphate phosphatase
MKQCVFLEPDGILIERGRSEAGPLKREGFRVRSEVAPLLNELKAAGFLLIATTNQPSVSGDLLPRRELDRLHDVLRQTFRLDDILVCRHEEMDRCTCRKPKPGLLVEASFKWRLDLSRSFVMSDKWQDAEAARRAGATSLLLSSPWLGTGHHDFVLPDLASLVDKVLQLSSPAYAMEAFETC